MNDLEMYLAKWDPIDLVSSGAPDDEYNLEAFEIARGYEAGMSLSQLAKLVHGTFVNLTGVDYEGFKAECQDHANEIKKILETDLKSNGSHASKREVVVRGQVAKLLESTRDNLTVKSSHVADKIANGQPVNLGELMDLKLDLASVKYNDQASSQELDEVTEQISGIISSNC